ncbi:hypothetical protein [Alteromonas sp. C1M14]|uniref:hypothetical protein n=1 Tax=Alteromonas sp. C1M14 TaxID=2841567 RepID=UPI001C099E6D|nr:hypothetical protein [Alteromonas sp. C1M14]MBU2978114.1 hypothetical protein [Alteromonas sp. C1M14]
MAKYLIGLLLLTGSVLAQEQQSDDLWAEMDNWEEQEVSPFSWAGFAEVALGRRLQRDDVIGRNTTLQDARVQLKSDYLLSSSKVSFRGDLYYDGVKNQLESQIRELYWQGNLGFLGTMGRHFDLKAGQQVLTWGTGDYLFLNDLFSKDYQSFFAGRDDDYLKAPSLSVKLSGYSTLVNFDVVITPEFEPDNGINGEYFSYFSPSTGTLIADEFSVLDSNLPDEPEYAIRLYGTLAGTELALYGYKGYSKLPQGADVQGNPRYSELTVSGFSAVRPIGAGIGKLEYAFYDGEDTFGNDPFTANDQSRLLIGYEQELIANLTGSLQWYTEFNHDYAALVANSLWPQYEDEERRHVLTTELRYLALQQTLTLQLFNFYSPSDNDGYLRLRGTYSPTDRWQISGGVNGFYGDETYTFYSQFKDGSNVYLAFRYFFEE